MVFQNLKKVFDNQKKSIIVWGDPEWGPCPGIIFPVCVHGHGVKPLQSFFLCVMTHFYVIFLIFNNFFNTVPNLWDTKSEIQILNDLLLQKLWYVQVVNIFPKCLRKRMIQYLLSLVIKTKICLQNQLAKLGLIFRIQKSS